MSSQRLIDDLNETERGHRESGTVGLRSRLFQTDRVEGDVDTWPWWIVRVTGPAGGSNLHGPWRKRSRAKKFAEIVTKNGYIGDENYIYAFVEPLLDKSAEEAVANFRD